MLFSMMRLSMSAQQLIGTLVGTCKTEGIRIKTLNQLSP